MKAELVSVAIDGVEDAAMSLDTAAALMYEEDGGAEENTEDEPDRDADEEDGIRITFRL